MICLRYKILNSNFTLSLSLSLYIYIYIVLLTSEVCFARGDLYEREYETCDLQVSGNLPTDLEWLSMVPVEPIENQCTHLNIQSFINN